jgi:hypothetical protein
VQASFLAFALVFELYMVDGLDGTLIRLIRFLERLARARRMKARWETA